MIQTIMFIALGFLCAGLLGLFIAPVLWRQAARITTKRIQSQSPLTMAEIQADRDQLKAEFALSTRKLELTVEELKEKNGRHVVEISRQTDRIDELMERSKDQAAQIIERDAKIMKLTSRAAPLEEDLRVKTELALQQGEKIRKQGETLERQRRALKEQSELASGRDSELAHLRNHSKQQEAEDRTFELAHQAMADRVNQLGRLAAEIERQRAKLYETRRDVSMLRESVRAEASNDPRQAQTYQRHLTRLREDRDVLLSDLERAERESSRLREEIGALETTWKSRVNPYGSLRKEVDAVTVDMKNMSSRLVAEIDVTKMQLEPSDEPPETPSNVTPITAARGSQDKPPAPAAQANEPTPDTENGDVSQTGTDNQSGKGSSSLAARIRALQNELTQK